MSNSEQQPAEVFRVVTNDEGRYSIWPSYKEIPWGWQAEGKIGSKEECLEHIEKVWTDMRPRSLQVAMQNAAQQEAPKASESGQ